MQDVQKIGNIGDFLVYIGMQVSGPGYSLSCLHRLSSFTSFDLFYYGRFLHAKTWIDISLYYSFEVTRFLTMLILL